MFIPLSCTKSIQWWTWGVDKYFFLSFPHKHTVHTNATLSICVWMLWTITPGPQIHLPAWNRETRDRQSEFPGYLWLNIYLGDKQKGSLTGIAHCFEWQQRAFSCLMPSKPCATVLCKDVLPKETHLFVCGVYKNTHTVYQSFTLIHVMGRTGLVVTI